MESFTSLLPSLTQSIMPAMQSPEVEFTMEIIEGSSGNVKKYNWDDRQDLPRELREAQESTADTSGLPPAISIEDIMAPEQTTGAARLRVG